MKLQDTTNRQEARYFSDTSAYPVNYQTGRVKMEATDITLPLGAVYFYHWRRHENSDKPRNDGKNGFAWKTNSYPKLTESQNGDIVAEFFGGKKIRFSPDAEGRLVRTDKQAGTIRLDEENHVYLVVRADQMRWTYHAEGSTDGPKGTPASIVDVEGKATRFVYDANGALRKVRAYRAGDHRQPLAELEYEYTPEKRIRSITQRLFNDKTNDLLAVKRVMYDYYAKDEPFGNPGDLKTVVTEIGDGVQWVNDGVFYYRYDAKHNLRFAVAPHDYAAAVEEFGADGIFTLDAESLLPFATKYYEYDEKGRVAREIVERGTRTITFEYTTFPKSGDPNDVCHKTVEKHLGGETNIVYLNHRGNTLLKETLPPEGVEEPGVVHWRVFDRHRRVIRHYHSNAIKRYELVVWATAKLDVEIEPDEGMIQINEYYENDSSGKVERKLVQRGENGTPIPLVSWERERIDGKIANLPVSKTEFADEAGKEAITTRVVREYDPNTKKIKRKTTMLPIVSEAENGDGQQAEQTEIFDAKGRPIWRKDELGIVSYSEYEPLRGRKIKEIVDADLTRTGDFAVDVPADWKNIDGSGKHLVTEYAYDFKGRLVETIDPATEAVDDDGGEIDVRQVDWTVYDDIHRTKISARGFAKLDSGGKIVGFELINPVSITVGDADGNLVESITASRESVEGKLLQTDVFARSSWLTWIKSVYRHGRLVAVREYCNIPANGDGKKDIDYAETTFAYDEKGRQNIVVSATGGMTKTVFDWQGNPIETWVGTSENDLVKVSSTVYGAASGGDCLSCGGGSQSNVLASVVHPDSGQARVTEYAYDWRGRRTHTVRDADESGLYVYSAWQYDNKDRVVAEETYHGNEKTEKKAADRLVARTEHRLDARGRGWKTVQDIIDPKTGEVEDRFESYRWHDAKGRAVRQADSKTKLVTKIVFDSLGREIISNVSVDGDQVRSSENVYDNTGKLLASISGQKRNDGRAMRYRYASRWYDAAGRQIAQADHGCSDKPVARAKKVPEKSEKVHLTKNVFDKKTGRLEKSVDAAGRERSMQFDRRGRAVKSFQKRGMKFVQGKKTILKSPEFELQAETIYNAAGLVVAQVDALGNRTTFEYDAHGRQTARIDALGGKTRFRYNNIGELIEQIDPMGRSTKFEYDNFGRRVRTILPAPKPGEKNPVQETVYDAFGRVVKRIDPLGHSTMMEYDAQGRVARKVDAEGGVTSFTYNEAGQLKSLTDPVGNTTSYEYDEQGRQVRETNELGKSRLFEYLFGNVVGRKVDRNGRTTIFEYDDFGRRTAEKWFGEDRAVKTFSYRYDEAGQIVSVADGVTTFDYGRDEDGREITATLALPGLRNPVVQETEYDALGRRTRIATVFGTKTEFSNVYAYTKTGQVASIEQTGRKRVDYRYDDSGMRTTTELFAQGREVAVVSQSYDGMGRLESIVQKHGVKTVAEYLYDWDAANRITGIQFADDKAEYGYDATSQLTSATYDKLPAEAYEYDSNGNREKFETGKNTDRFVLWGIKNA